MAEPASRPIPGAGASPAIPRRAGPARPTAPVQRQRRSNAGSRGLRASTAWSCIMRILRRRPAASRASSSAASSSASRACARHRASIRRSRGCGPWRRRCVRSCARPRRSSMRPTGRNTARMFSTAATRCAFPSIRFSPTTTSMRSASIIIRRSPTGATAPNHADLAAARSVNDVDYLRGRLGSGEAFDWYYATSSERNCADAPADHRRRLRQAMGLPAEGSRLLVVEPAYGAGGRRRDRRDRMAAAIEADLAHRDRHSRRRQGAERTERLSRSEILGIRLSAVLPRRARRSRPGARRWRRSSRASTRLSAALRPVQSGLDVL